MVDLEEGADVRMLMKKLWCHGQAIAPLQGFAYAVWALSDDGALSFSFRVLLWVAALKFPVWGYVSWQCLQLIFGPRSFLILAMLGAIVIAVDMLSQGLPLQMTNSPAAGRWSPSSSRACMLLRRPPF